MTDLKTFLIATLLVASTLVARGEAISCYTCSSRNGTDTDCQDPFNPAHSTYTEGCKVPKEGHIGHFPANFCLKVIGKTIDTGIELVIRACTLENMDNQCGVFRFEGDTFKGCILTCDYDGCNSAPSSLGLLGGRGWASAIALTTFVMMVVTSTTMHAIN